MRNFLVISIALLSFSNLLVLSAQAGDLEWKGLYRAEGVHVKNAALNGDGDEKEYGLHHLILSPKIVLGDGLIVYSRFDIFNSGTYPNSQLGQFFGEIDSGSTGAGGSIDNNAAVAQQNQADSLVVNHLYLTLVQEFGSLIVGRAPVHFGLGMNHNSGNGLFDHWLDNRDLFGYKIVMGNLFFFPMLGKLNEGDLSENDDTTDYMVQMQYENPETDLEMGIFYQTRKSSGGGVGFPTSAVAGSVADPSSGVKFEFINAFVKKDTERFKVAIEFGHQSGKTGVNNASGKEVKLSGSGVAAEFEYRPIESKWKFGLNGGFATGDDPESDDEFEGYFFDRNYDVAFLLFNHPMGENNFFASTLATGGHDVNKPDVEAITNVTYFSPYVHYQWKDNWSLQLALTTGILDAVDKTADWDSDVGYELDFGLTFSPNERMTWVNQIGYFTPGKAFEGGSSDFDAKTAYGFITKAAISF